MTQYHLSARCIIQDLFGIVREPSSYLPSHQAVPMGVDPGISPVKLVKSRHIWSLYLCERPCSHQRALLFMWRQRELQAHHAKVEKPGVATDLMQGPQGSVERAHRRFASAFPGATARTAAAEAIPEW